jgi:hypothetical protein
METLSFILGIAFVVVIAIAIVAVYAFVKVKEAREELSSIHQSIGREIENLNRVIEMDRRSIESPISDLYRQIEDKTQNVFRVMDSRFDKLENKLTSPEQVKK